MFSGTALSACATACMAEISEIYRWTDLYTGTDAAGSADVIDG